MKSIKDSSFDSFAEFQVEDISTVNSVIGGKTTTENATYIAREQGGEFDTSRETRRIEKAVEQ